MRKRGTTLRERIDKPTRLGEMLRVYRTVNYRNRGLRSIAKEIGVSHATLFRLEHGQSMDAETLLKVCLWLLTVEPE